MQAFRVDIRIGLVGGGPVKGPSATSLLVTYTWENFDHVPESAHLNLMIPVVKVLKLIIHDQAVLPLVRLKIARGWGWHLLRSWGCPEFPSSKGTLQYLRGYCQYCPSRPRGFRLTKSDKDACVKDDTVPIDVLLGLFEPWLLELALESTALEASSRAVD